MLVIIFPQTQWFLWYLWLIGRFVNFTWSGEKAFKVLFSRGKSEFFLYFQKGKAVFKYFVGTASWGEVANLPLSVIKAAWTGMSKKKPRKRITEEGPHLQNSKPCESQCVCLTFSLSQAISAQTPTYSSLVEIGGMGSLQLNPPKEGQSQRES